LDEAIETRQVMRDVLAAQEAEREQDLEAARRAIQPEMN
jgi:hypothetical protein